MATGGTVRSQRRVRAKRRRPGRRLRSLALAVAILGACAATGVGQMSGQFGIDLIARKIPTTLTDEIGLDTPSEYSELEFAIASDLDVTANFGFADVTIDLGTNMAGAEHAVGVVDVQLAPVQLGGTTVEDIHVKGEMWYAVPFEAVTDVNNLPNSCVIPPGGPFFVTARFTVSFEYEGFAARWLGMIQDVAFPNPNAAYADLTYDDAKRDVGLGSILFASWTSPLGSSLSVSSGLNSSLSSTVIKGYSDSGRVDVGECSTDWGNCFLNGSLSGIPLCDTWLGVFALTDATMGVSFSVSTTQTLSATVSYSAKVADDVRLSTSLELFKDPVSMAGLNLSGSLGCFSFGVALDKLAITSLSAGCNTPFSLGALTGAFSLGATGLQAGLTGLSMRLSLSQGVFAASTNLAFAQRGDEFGFSSLGTQLTYRIPPGSLSIQATFGRFGLTRAAVGAGVTF